MATAVSSTQACRNFIGGKWIESKSAKIAERRNPANTDEVVARVPLSSREEMREAIAAAKAAFPAWRDTPAPNRGKILFKAVRIMEEQKEELARMLTLEEGKALKDSLGEVQRSINILEFMAGEARRLNGESYPSELPKNFSYTVRTPIGVIGAITPWNFPLRIPVWKVAPALVAGNTCVLKPAELTPLCAIRMTEIFEQAGLPAGVLNLVLGAGEEVGDELVQNPDVRAISFTGSTEIGCQIYASGARRMQKVQCEMGGKNPVVILADADLPLAVESVVSGAFASTGQRCTATSRVVIEESVANKFVAMLAERTKKVHGGQWPGTWRRYGAVGGREADEHGAEIYRDRKERRQAAVGRRAVDGARIRQGIFCCADDIRSCGDEEPNRAGGDLWSCVERDSREEFRRSVGRGEFGAIWVGERDLQQRCEQGFRVHRSHRDGDHTRQFTDRGRRGAFALWRNQRYRSGPPRGGARGAGFLHGAEDGLY